MNSVGVMYLYDSALYYHTVGDECSERSINTLFLLKVQASIHWFTKLSLVYITGSRSYLCFT